VTIQEKEIEDYRWATFDEAKELITYETRLNILNNVRELLHNIDTQI